MSKKHRRNRPDSHSATAEQIQDRRSVVSHSLPLAGATVGIHTQEAETSSTSAQARTKDFRGRETDWHSTLALLLAVGLTMKFCAHSVIRIQVYRSTPLDLPPERLFITVVTIEASATVFAPVGRHLDVSTSIT